MKHRPRTVSLLISMIRHKGETWRECLNRYLEKANDMKNVDRSYARELFDEYLREGTSPDGAALTAIGLDCRVIDWQWIEEDEDGYDGDTGEED
jgi:hypothetical protein